MVTVWQAYFDTSKHSKLHAAGAEWFFYIETIAVLLNVRELLLLASPVIRGVV